MEPFLSKGTKIPKFNRWSMELADYNMIFVHIEGKNNVLVDIISRLKRLTILQRTIAEPKCTSI